MENLEFIDGSIIDFIDEFRQSLEKSSIDTPELPDEKITNYLKEYFNIKKFSEARDYLYDIVGENIPGRHNHVDWSLGREEAMETLAYKEWKRYSDISYAWHNASRYTRLEDAWVMVNGKTHTDEEAAMIAADNWCELLFGWHMQDNGALDEMHGGGFPACALGTILADKAKENISEEMKIKAHELFYQYYLKSIHYDRTYDSNDIRWLETTLKDDTGEFDWKYGFDYDMYCDYDPAWSLYLILTNSGIEDSDARHICPWKTGISIRREDNAVMYTTYQKREEI